MQSTESRRTTLVLSRKSRQAIWIEDVRVEVVGGAVQLAVTADINVKILREELLKQL